MKKKFRNCLSLILCLLLALTCFAGCGGETAASAEETVEAASVAEASAEDVSAEEAPAEEAPVEEASAEEAPAEEVPEEEPAVVINYPLENPETDTMTMWIAAAPFIFNNLPDIDSFGDLLVFTEAEKATGIHLDITCVTTQTQSEKYSLMCASGDMTDIMPASSSYTGGIDAAVEDEILLEISGLLEDNMPDYVSAVLNDPENVKYVTSDNGNMTDILGPTIPNGTGAIIRKDWLDELGLDIPVTYDDYYNVLTAFKSEYNITQPILMLNSGIPGGDALTSGFNTGAYGSDMGSGYNDSFYVEDGVVKFGLVEPGFQEYLIMINKWYNEGLISADFVSQATSQVELVTSAIADSQMGIWYGGSDYFGADYIAAYGDPDYDPAPIADPVQEEGQILHTGYKGAGKGVTSGTLWAIGANCAYPETALQYINYFFTEEGQWLCNYGVEGYSYNMVDGEIEFTELITNPESMTAFGAKYIYTSWGVPFVEFAERFNPLYTTEEQLTLSDVWNSNRDTEWVIRGTMNTEESSAFSATYTDINTYCQEAVVQFVLGELDAETEFQAFVDKCYEMGLQDCIDLKQDAEDRYLAR